VRRLGSTPNAAGRFLPDGKILAASETPQVANENLDFTIAWSKLGL
jgi:hypothetical protein